MSGPKTEGLNRLTWDGTTDSGQKATDGVYGITISATDAYGKAINITDTRLIGQVTGVQTDSNKASTLSLGNVSVKDTDIDAVFNSTTVSSASATGA